MERGFELDAKERHIRNPSRLPTVKGLVLSIVLKESTLKRLVIGLSLTFSLFLPTALVASAGSTNGNGRQFTCTTWGSSYEGLHAGEAKKLERSGYICVEVG